MEMNKDYLKTREIWNDVESTLITVPLEDREFEHNYEKYINGEYFIIDCRSLSDEPGKNKYEDYCKLIDKATLAMTTKRKVALGCTAGISRSNAIAMGWLIMNRGMDYDEAYAHVRKKIKCCLIEPTHLKNLKRLAKEKKVRDSYYVFIIPRTPDEL